MCFFFFFSSRRRHTRFDCDWSSDVCSSDLRRYAKTRMMCGGMMLVLISEVISNSNAVIRQDFRKLRFQMIDDSELTRRVLLLSRLESDGFGGSGGVWRCLLWPSRTPWHDGCTVTTELQKGSMFTTAAPMD